PPQPRPHHIPLSHAQQRLWFLHQFEPDSALYNIPVALKLTGALDVTALRRALDDVVVRHESLRTVFVPDDDGTGAYQVVQQAAPLDVAVVEVDADALQPALRAAAGRSFDLSAEPPLHATLFRTAADEHVLLLVMHHIAGDGWSLSPLARDLSTAYTARHT
ncbi:condensation domain-containing protein, partial [Streptomyces violaceorubidus]|uniref:condensation domain-containing protein n=1 Tax=Streptomyces violaceorubidus TaxID=284042 RepID=UPI000565A8DA